MFSQAEYYYWAFPVDYYKQQKSVDCNQVSLGSIQIWDLWYYMHALVKTIEKPCKLHTYLYECVNCHRVGQSFI